MSKSITNLNKKSKLFLIREAPQTLFPKLFKSWNISHLVFEKDIDGYGRQRDVEVMKLAREAGVEVLIRSGRTLWDSDQLVAENGGRPTMSISQVEKAGPKIGPIARPIPAPTSLPDPGDISLDFDQEQPPDAPDMNSHSRTAPNKSYYKLAGPNDDFAPPTLAELGMPAATTKHRGGETEGLATLEAIIANKKYTATFEKPKTAPTDFDPQATTLLSPHMHFGSVSCRDFYWRVQDVVDAYGKSASSPPVSLTGQLLFRDMYFGAQAALGRKFSQTLGNPTIRFIPWHLPSRVDTAGTGFSTGDYDIDSPAAHAWFQRWKYGRTGFPFVDAIMRQLRLDGWIHHLARHMVACFLTRGGCYVDWERGADVFEEWLIDHETACNAGNWQWLSCTAFYSQFYRCYSPVAFGSKWDPEGAFIRKFVPELAAFDKKFIYEPHRAPVADQKKWGCVVRGDGGAEAGKLDEDLEPQDGCKVYPKPMFDFGERRQICIQGMKKAYQVGLRGNDKEVLDGTWRRKFEDGAEGPTEGTDGLPGAQGEGDGEDGEDGMDEGHEDDDDHQPARQSAKGRKHQRPASAQGTLDSHIKRTKK